MTKSLRVDVFVEDSAHERLLLRLLQRVARERGAVIQTQVLSARGGHARAVDAMAATQRALLHSGTQRRLSDLFVVGIDGNCTTSHAKSKQIAERCVPEYRDRLVIACPDPHVEKWYMADPVSFHRVVGATPKVGTEKCQRDYYKHLLAVTIAQGDQPAPLGGIEFADELVDDMDLHRASRNDASLGHFLSSLRSALILRA